MNSRYKELSIQLNRKLNNDFLGSFHHAFSGAGIEFDSIRHYIPWDSVRNIDWKTTAKRGTVHVRNYEDEKNINVIFYIELSDTLLFGSKNTTKKHTLEEVFFLLAQCSLSHWLSVWIYIQATNNHSVWIDFCDWEEIIIQGLATINDHYSQKHVSKNNISQQNISENTGFKNKKYWSSVLKNMKLKNNIVFQLTDKDPLHNNDCHFLNNDNEIIVVQIFDHFENNLTDMNLSFFTWITSICTTQTSHNQYIQHREKALFETKKQLWKKNIRYVSLDDHDDIFTIFYTFFMSSTQ